MSVDAVIVLLRLLFVPFVSLVVVTSLLIFIWGKVVDLLEIQKFLVVHLGLKMWAALGLMEVGVDQALYSVHCAGYWYFVFAGVFLHLTTLCAKLIRMPLIVQHVTNFVLDIGEIGPNG